MMPGAQVGLELGRVSGKGPTLHSFTPTTPSFAHTNLYAWLDASDSLTLDGSGRVSSWLDKVSGNLATQTDPTLRPYTNAVNGLQCAYWPPSNNYHLDANYLTAGCFEGTSPWMISFVWNVGSQSINQFALSMLGDTGVFCGFIGSNLHGERANGGGADSVDSNQSGGPMVYSLTYDTVGALRLRKNGTECAAIGSTMSLHHTLFWIGGDMREGGTRYIYANLCEIVIYNAYDMTQLSSAEAYLRDKWNAVY